LCYSDLCNTSGKIRLYKPFLKLKDIKQLQAMYPNFPPKDGSPPIVLEPWGKNLFVYHAKRNVDFKGDDRAPPSNWPNWLVEKRRLGMLLPGEDPNELIDGGDRIGGSAVTQLCITDFRKRIQTHLTKDDFHAIKDRLEELKKAMNAAEIAAQRLNEMESVDRTASRQQVETEGDRFRIYRKGRWMKPRHHAGGRGAMTGRLRLPRKK
jgi:hypothetical protein